MNGRKETYATSIQIVNARIFGYNRENNRWLWISAF